MTSRKKIGFIIIILASLAAAWYVYNMANQPVGTLEDVSADMSIQASTLLSSYQADEAESDLKYLDKIIAVTGVITKIENNDGLNIHLETDDMLSGVICKLDNTYSDANYKVGDSVSIKGLCTGYLMDVLLVNSSFVN